MYKLPVSIFMIRQNEIVSVWNHDLGSYSQHHRWKHQNGAASAASQLHFHAFLLFFALLRFTPELFSLHHFSKRIKNYKAREIIWMWIK